ncbi:hypothetical protein LTS18_004283 [Coniosporium uncinatum]|uniref:Uncharacterized protein n=1 Tax=Coniosporium uncinatum TaxID=93489 RepID=A0ACC3DZY4_9PEZI|nr:hypothetical protein LTS18_004283 [Coniosporium uncinatum]
MALPQFLSLPLALTLSLLSILPLLFSCVPQTAAQSIPNLEYPPFDYAYSSSALVVRATDNLQTFNGSLGGIAAPAITKSGDAERPFRVGDDRFAEFDAAARRTCDVQHNACADAANAATSANRAAERGGRERGGREDREAGGGEADEDESGEKKKKKKIQQRRQQQQQQQHRQKRQERGQNLDRKRQGPAPPPLPLAPTTLPPPEQEGSGGGEQEVGGLTVAQCDRQKRDCDVWQAGVAVQSFGQENLGPDPQGDGGFDLVCDVNV